MKFEKRNFMGIELDVLVGHPEHELIFFGMQVAAAAGLRDPSGSVMAYRQTKEAKLEPKLSLGGLLEGSSIKAPECKVDGSVRTFRSTMAMLTEQQTFKMLLRGNAPQSEPFRKWVTEEVLPTIRKTGSYNAETSANPIAVGVMDELKVLRGEIAELKLLIQAMPTSTAPQVVVKSPYEGVTKGTVWYHKDVQAIRKAGETLRMSVTVVDKLTPYLLIQLEKDLIAKWRAKDSRTLDCEFSANGGRNWTLWPMNFLKANLMHTHYVDALAVVMNERMTK